MFYGLSDESEYCFDKKLFNIKKEKRSRKNEGFDIFYDNLNKKIYLAQNELYNRNLEFLFDNRKNYLIFSYTHYEKVVIRSKYSRPCPNICNITKPYDSYQLGGIV